LLKVRVGQVSAVKRYVVRDMQKLRTKLLSDLEDVFNMAKTYAKSKDPKVTPKQRQIWIRIMAYAGQVMNSITKSFDEAQITKDLANLEKMINEAMAKEKSRGSPAPS
jgi:ArsR family metal-binding transcriptional regulator